jgi:hypothetical protein
MIRLTLSDFAGDRLKASAFQRQSDYENQLAIYNQILTDRQVKAKRLKAKSQELWKKRELFAWFLSLFPRIAHSSSLTPSKPRMALANDKEHILYAGSEGERVVADYFASGLDDQWTMISGYKGYRGEIDQILVGSFGILALEIKTINGVIYVNGDSWHRDKYDRWGNLVEQGLPILDNGGRSPSQQISQATEPLERFLKSRIPNLPKISRAAIFAHERSRIAKVDNQTIEMIANINGVTPEAFKSVFAPIDDKSPIDTAKVVELIKRDHEYQAKRRTQRGRGA